MNPSDKSGESKGIVLFAFNTDSVDYLKIAENSARLIKKHLKLPVSVVTDQVNFISEFFDTISFVPSSDSNFRTGLGGGQSWRNLDRYEIYNLSPYEITCLIDSDVLVFDDSLLKYFDLCEDYLLLKNQIFSSGSLPNTLGSYKLPQLWASIVWFKKTKISDLYFQLVHRIQTNYHYYRGLYQISQENYRNDYAFTIAHNIISGYKINVENCVPYKLHAVDEIIDSIEIKNQKLIVKTEKKAYVYPLSCLHVLDKKYLFSTQFNTLVDNYVKQ